MTSNTSSIKYTIEPSRLSLAYLRWMPFVILLLAASVIALRWGQIPDRWVTHWNFRGEPDGWASKTFLAVTFPLLIGTGVCTFLEAISTWVASLRSFGEGYKGEPTAAAAIGAATGGLLRLVNMAIAMLSALVAVQLPLYPSGSPKFIVVFALGSIIIAFVIGSLRIMAVYRDLKQAGLMAGMEGFNGIAYSNPDDPRLWVPKPLGYGYTINFGHRWAWPVFLTIIGIPLCVVLFIIVLSAG